MMAPTLRRLQNEILRSFDYYKEEFREEKIDRIFLTGGSSRLLNLGEFLSNALGIKVETVDPVDNLKIDKSSGIDQAALKEVSPRLALAIGLALEKSEKINLQKKMEKPRKFIAMGEIFKDIHLEIPVNITAFSAVALLVLAILYNFYLAGIRDNYKKELASKQAILTDVKTLVERKAILEQISKEESHVRETLSQLTRALPRGIVLTKLTYDNAKRQILLIGEAKDTNTVGRMIKNFEDSESFKQTVLIEARKASVESVQRIIFKVTVNLT